MKSESTKVKKAESINGQCIGDALIEECNPFIRAQTKSGLSTVFLMHIKGKAPPGRKQGPGEVSCLNPDKQISPFLQGRTLFSIEIQDYKRNKLSKFYHN